MSFIAQTPGEMQTYSQILDKAVNGDHSSLLFVSLNGTKTLQILAKFSILASCAIKERKKVYWGFCFFAIFFQNGLVVCCIFRPVPKLYSLISSSHMIQHNKLASLPQTSLSRLVYYLQVRLKPPGKGHRVIFK
jgi:hypothetical protein